MTSVGIGAIGVISFRQVDRHVALGPGRTRALNAILILTPIAQVISSAIIESH